MLVVGMQGSNEVSPADRSVQGKDSAPQVCTDGVCACMRVRLGKDWAERWALSITHRDGVPRLLARLEQGPLQSPPQH